MVLVFEGMKGYDRAMEAQHCVAGLESLKRAPLEAIGESAAQL